MPTWLTSIQAAPHITFRPPDELDGEDHAHKRCGEEADPQRAGPHHVQLFQRVFPVHLPYITNRDHKSSRKLYKASCGSDPAKAEAEDAKRAAGGTAYLARCAREPRHQARVPRYCATCSWVAASRSASPMRPVTAGRWRRPRRRRPEASCYLRRCRLSWRCS